MGKGTATEDEQLEAVVEHGRIAAVGVDDGQNFFYVVAEQVGLEHGLAGVHPVDIAAEGVDFAVMGEVAVGMGAIPAWKGVGAETGVDQGQRAFHQGIIQVGIILIELLGQKHAFINQRFVGKAGDVPVTRLGERQLRYQVRRAFPYDIQFPLERHVLFEGAATRDKDLPDEGLGGLGRGAQRSIVCGDRAPADDLQALFFHDFLECPLALLSFRRVLRQENQTGAILACLGELEAGLFTLLLEKGVWHLQEDASAVARVGFTPASAAMIEVAQDLEGLLDDLVGFVSFDVDHETDAAGFMFKPRIIEALLVGQTVCCCV